MSGLINKYQVWCANVYKQSIGAVFGCKLGLLCYLLVKYGLMYLLRKKSYQMQLYGGARGVMVIVTGYGHGDTSSIPGQDWLHFT